MKRSLALLLFAGCASETLSGDPVSLVWKPVEGTSETVRWHCSLNFKFIQVLIGKEQPVDRRITIAHKYVSTIGGVANGRVQARTVEIQSATFDVSGTGEPRHGEIVPKGTTLTIERRDGRIIETPPNSRSGLTLEPDWVDFLPPRPVRVGEVWEPDPASCRSLALAMAVEGVLNVRVKALLASIADSNAVIELAIVFDFKTQGMASTMSLRGPLSVDRSTGRPVAFKIAGTIKLDSQPAEVRAFQGSCELEWSSTPK